MTTRPEHTAMAAAIIAGVAIAGVAGLVKLAGWMMGWW